MLAVLLCLVSERPAVTAGPPPAPPLAGGATKLEFVRGMSEAMGLDEEGTVWKIFMGRLFCWTGERFRQVGEQDKTFVSLIGGPDRGLYAIERAQMAPTAALYRLRNGAARFECNFSVGRTGARPAAHVSRSGRLFTWGDGFLACRLADGWKRIRARLSVTDTLVFDVGDEVYFCHASSLYCADASNALSKRDRLFWSPASAKGVLWAGRRVVLFAVGSPDLFAFDLLTGRRITLVKAFLSDRDIRFYDALALRNGDVLLIGAKADAPGFGFFRLSTDGRLEKIAEADSVRWARGLYMDGPGRCLETPAGEIVFILPRQGIGVFRDGAISLWRWQYGLDTGSRQLHEAPDGSIWFALSLKVAKLTLGSGPPPLSPLTAVWEEFALQGGNVWQTAPGEVAMFRKDRPHDLSRWNGREWRHQRVPFDTTRVGRQSAVDDRGHVLLAEARPAAVFDVGPDSVRQFDTMQSLLEEAVREGARDFSLVDGFRGIVVTSDGRIWLEDRGNLHLYDGERWRMPWVPSHVTGLQMCRGLGMMIRGYYADSWYLAEGEEVVEMPRPREDERQKLMLTENGLWPYEREFLDEHSGYCFPVIKEGRLYTLFLRRDEFETALKTGSVPQTAATVQFGSRLRRMKRTLSGGMWLMGTGQYIMGETAHRFRPSTPLPPELLDVDIQEDGAGSLWFYTSKPDPTAFRYKLPHIAISGPDGTGPVSPEWAFDIRVDPDPLPEGVELFQRLNEGPWQHVGREQRRCSFLFPAGGRHRCEIAAFEYGARTPGGLTLEVDARGGTQDASQPEAEPTTGRTE